MLNLFKYFNNSIDIWLIKNNYKTEADSKLKLKPNILLKIGVIFSFFRFKL